jgi:two-component system nitrogen regulation response regulator GlnG
MAADPKQKILIIDDESDVHYSFKRLLSNEPLEVDSAASGEEGLRLLKKEQPDVVVMDIRMGKESGLDTLREIRRISPKQIVIMMTAYGTSQTAIEAMKLGAFDYVLKPFDISQLKDLLKRALEAARAMKEMVRLPGAPNPDDFRTGIVGQSPAMQQVYKLVGQVAPTEATVLITGESGTGKELVARAIYSNSRRSNKTYIPINCAAIPDNLLESELFGHEKGSFTGASSQRIGKFEQCDGGTLFLDEIGDMPMQLQTKILRVLQDGEFFRIGGDNPIRTDVRIIAATNKDLWSAVQKKEFREDLYYRLNVVSIKIPSLRERPGDIPQLVAYFMNKYRSRQPSAPVKISDEALAVLSGHHWPGNVRELENCVQRAMVLASGDTISSADLPPELRVAGRAPGRPTVAPVDVAAVDGDEALDRAMAVLFEHARSRPGFELLPAAERELIRRALDLTSGNQVQAAKLLGITRATLRKRVEQFGFSKETSDDKDPVS